MPRPRTNKISNNNSDEPVTKIARHSTRVELTLPSLPTKTGKLLSCGTGDVGQMGLGEDVLEKTRPALVSSITEPLVDVYAGGMHSLCLSKTGNVYSFGCNDEGALGRDTKESSLEFTPTKIDLPAKCLRISAGDSHSACLLEDGRVYAWGSFRDSHGNMGLTLDGNQKFPIEVLPQLQCVDIASGADHLVILTASGHIYTLGCAEQGQLGRVSSRTASGESRRGKTHLLMPEIVNIKGGRVLADAIWATTYCTFLRQKDSNIIYGFGLNNYAQLGLNVAKSLVFSPVIVPFKNVKEIAGGQHHTLILTNDNKCSIIGRKDYGRLGLGDITEDIVELTSIPSLKDLNIIHVSCGESCSFAVTSDGKVYSFGFGSNYQLGSGDDEDILIPKHLVSAQVKEKCILKVSSGGQHTLFLVEADDLSKKDEIVKIEKVKKTTSKEPVLGDGDGKSSTSNNIGKNKNDAVEPLVNGSVKTENGNSNEVPMEAAPEAAAETAKTETASEITKRGRKRKN